MTDEYGRTPGNRIIRHRDEEHPARTDIRSPTNAHRWDHDDDGAELLSYLAVLRRHGRLALAVFAFVVAGVLVGTLLQPPSYQASGLLEIRRVDSDVVPMEALFQGQNLSNEYLRTQYGLLRSNALALRVVRDLDLHRVEEFREGLEDSEEALAGAPSAAELQPVIEKFLEKLTVSPQDGSRLVRVHFVSEEPERAARVVNSLLDNFVGMRVEGGEDASGWLAQQLDSTRERLEAAEQNLQDYAATNGLPLARGDEDVAMNVQERLDALETNLTEARTERLALEARYQTLVGDGRYESVENPVIDDLTLRLAELRREHARLTSTFQDDYPEVQRLDRQISELESQLTEERNRIARRVTGEFEAANRREQMLEDAVVQEKAFSDSLMERAAGYRILRREVEATRQVYGALQEKLQEAEVSTALAGANVGIVDRAVPPDLPFRPSIPLSLAFAIAGGAILALGAAFGREFLDNTVRTAEEVSASTDIPLLAMIPTADRVNGARRLAGAGVGSLVGGSGSGFGNGQNGDGGWVRIDEDRGPRFERSSAIAEAFGTLRTSVIFNDSRSAARSILITSCRPGEGKTTVSVNFAISLARMGRDVLLIDADMRKPAVHRALGGIRAPGLAEYLEGGEEWSAVVNRDHLPGLDVIHAGRRVESPDTLLSSPRLQALLEEAHERYDFVVVDAPALFINAADARIVAARTDGVVLVVRSGSTPKKALRRVMGDIPNVLGVVLNDLDPGSLPEYYQDYYQESSEADDTNLNANRRR